MKPKELIDAFEMGDMGDVEFTELALDAGMTVEEIGKALARAKQEDDWHDPYFINLRRS